MTKGIIGKKLGMTQGRGNYSMQFSNYDEAPRNVAEEIIAKVRGSK